MASDWLTTATNTLGTLTVAGLGFRFAKQQSRDRNEYEQNKAHEDRIQDRLAKAYIEMLEVIHAFGQWAESVLPIAEERSPAPLPSFPTFEEQRHLQVLAVALASSEVRELIAAWQTALDAFAGAYGYIIRMRSHPDVEYPRDMAVRLEQVLRPAERAARTAIGERIAMELHHRDWVGIEPRELTRWEHLRAVFGRKSPRAVPARAEPAPAPQAREPSGDEAAIGGDSEAEASA